MNNIMKIRKQAGLSQAAFGKLFGAAQNTVCNWENGKREPDNVTLRRIAEHFRVTIDYVLGKTEETQMPRQAAVRVPVLSHVPAGIPIEAIDEILDWEEIPAEWAEGDREYFATIVQGDSMYPKYQEGDVIIVRKQTTCESGQDCVVYVNGYDATLKKVYLLDDGGIRLQPINPAYNPRTYYDGDVPIMIAGVVVEIRRKP